MSQETFKIKRNDTYPVIKYQLINDEDGKRYSLSGTETVKFFMKNSSGTVKVDGSATIVDALNGIVQYSWVAADTDTSGFFQAEFQITDGGQKVSVPNDASLYVQIFEDISE